MTSGDEAGRWAIRCPNSPRTYLHQVIGLDTCEREGERESVRGCARVCERVRERESERVEGTYPPHLVMDSCTGSFLPFDLIQFKFDPNHQTKSNQIGMGNDPRARKQVSAA